MQASPAFRTVRKRLDVRTTPGTEHPGRLLSMSLVLVCACLLARCTSSDHTPTGLSLTISPESAQIRIGTTVQLQAVGAQGTVRWSTSDSSIATVDHGLVSGIGRGTATITASADSKSATASITVTRPPTMSLAAAAASFAATAGATAPAAQTVAITNGGDETVDGLAVGTISYGPGASSWLTATVSGATAPAILTLQPNTTSLPPGTYTASVPVTSTTAVNSPVAVTVTYTVTQAPVIALAPQTVTFSAQQAGPTPAGQTVAITNAGGGPLTGLAVGTVSYGGGASGWLSTSLSTTATPATLGLQPNTTSLQPGTYTATVPITSTVPGVAAASVTVTYTITQPPLITLALQSVSFTAQQNGGLPAIQFVGITNTGGGTLAGLAVGTISYSAGASGWLAASVNPAAAPATLALQPTTTSLPQGTYTATVPITSSVPGVAAASVTVTYTVTPLVVPPMIALSATSVSFSAISGGASPGPQAVSISNSGGGSLTGLAVAVTYTSGQPTGWLSASLTTTTAPSSLSLQPTTTGLPPGTYTATVQLSAPGASNTPQQITVTYTVAQAPVIALSTASLSFSATTGGSPPGQQTLTITNAGGSTLSGLAATVAYTAGQPTGWLAASINPTAAPATLAVQPTTVLAPGTYTATVQVSAPGASNSPQSVAVTYTVAAPPALSLGTTSATFSTTSSTAPAAQQIAVNNTGGGSLTGLTTSIQYGPADWPNVSGWLQATVASSAPTAPASTPLTLQVTPGTLLPGTYHATVTVSAPGVTSQAVSVTFTRVATLAGDVQPIFGTPNSGNCASCHTNPNAPEGADLSTTNNSYTSLINVPVSEVQGAVRVIPGDSTNSYLYKQVKGVATNVNDNMPLGCSNGSTATGCLQPTLVRIIGIWIKQGATKIP